MLSKEQKQFLKTLLNYNIPVYTKNQDKDFIFYVNETIFSNICIIPIYEDDLFEIVLQFNERITKQLFPANKMTLYKTKVNSIEELCYYYFHLNKTSMDEFKNIVPDYWDKLFDNYNIYQKLLDNKNLQYFIKNYLYKTIEITKVEVLPFD